MPRSNVVISRQPSPQMKSPHHPQTHHSQLHHQQPHYPQPDHPHHPNHPNHTLVNQHASTASLSHSTASDLHSLPDHFLPYNSHTPTQSHDHHHQNIHSFVKVEHVTQANPIPQSVKGAPVHLRPAIRKRQNSESAKRSRHRRKEAAKIFYERFDEQCSRLSRLEQKVAHLIQLVKDTDEDRPSEPRAKQEEEVVPESAPSQHPSVQPQPLPHTTDADRPQPHALSIIQSMAAALSPPLEEHQDHRTTPQLPFEDDFEALLETCIHSQHMFGSC